MTGIGENYQERQRRRVVCPECDVSLAQSSLAHHRRVQYGRTTTSGLEPTEAFCDPMEYRVSFPKTVHSIDCPIKGCPGKATSRANLRAHFMYRHVRDTLVILDEGRFPILDVCIAICLFRGLPYTPPTHAQQCAGVGRTVNDSATLWMRHARPVSTCSWLKVYIWIRFQFSSILADCCRITMMIGQPSTQTCAKPERAGPGSRASLHGTGPPPGCPGCSTRQ